MMHLIMSKRQFCAALLPYSRRLLVPHFFLPRHTSCARKKFARFQSFESLDGDAGDADDDDGVNDYYGYVETGCIAYSDD